MWFVKDTRTGKQKAIDLLLTGKTYHSKELDRELGWDWRKYISVAKKHLKEFGIEVTSTPADHHFHNYKVQND